MYHNEGGPGGMLEASNNQQSNLLIRQKLRDQLLYF